MRNLSTIVMSAGVAALLAAGSAAAEGPRYTYADLGYVNFDFDEIAGIGADGDGFNVGGSVAVSDFVHLFASYTDGEVDVDDFGFGEIGVDYTEIKVGPGVNYAVSDTVDLVGRLAWLSVEAEAFGFSEDEDGYALSGGLRAMVTPKLELNGGVEYADLGGDDGDDTVVGLGGVYSFTDIFAVTAGVSFSDDATQYGIGARAYFGTR